MVWSSRECACCACDPSVHLDAPFMCFVVNVMSLLSEMSISPALCTLSARTVVK